LFEDFLITDLEQNLELLTKYSEENWVDYLDCDE